jgi:MFS family permease
VGPSFISLRYGMELASAGFWFGLVTVAAGAIATIVGGILVDRAQRQVDGRGGSAGLRERRAIGEMIRICGIGMLIAAPATVVLFWMPSALPFFVFAFIAEIGVFLSTSPVNAATLRSVPPGAAGQRDGRPASSRSTCSATSGPRRRSAVSST